MFKSRYKTNTLQRLIVKIKTKAWNLYWEEMAAISLSQFFCVCVGLALKTQSASHMQHLHKHTIVPSH